MGNGGCSMQNIFENKDFVSSQNSDIVEEVTRMAQVARQTTAKMNRVSSDQKNHFLKNLSKLIDTKREALIDVNQKDVIQAQAQSDNQAFLNRLILDNQVINGMIEGIKKIINLDDPVGKITHLTKMPSGIQVGQMRVPLGVIGVIYESRPNVTIDAAALCVKAGNVVLLRGGSEALQTNNALFHLIREAFLISKLPVTAVQFINSANRQAVNALLSLPKLIDVIIPRGGRNLIEKISEESSVPMIKHLQGNCHIFIDEGASLEKAIRVSINAKTQRTGTCNALETLLIAKSECERIGIALLQSFHQAKVALRCCSTIYNYCLAHAIPAVLAEETDWETEFLAPILAIKAVDNINAAIEHINHYGSAHTDAIITQNDEHAYRFLREVDSASVMVNASTRFADGYEYGLGGEIGISTDKLHARGPVGLKGLTSQKYVVIGNGEIRQ